MKAMKFGSSVQEDNVIWQIAERAVRNSIYENISTCARDITACHLNGNPLRLQDLLDSDDYTFNHDLFGIKKYLDRDSGQLRDFWAPRMSK